MAIIKGNHLVKVEPEDIVNGTFNIPEGITSIDDRAFEGCWNLESIIIPNSVTHIGVDAFSECSSLKSIVIPDSVTSIGAGAFYQCRSLESIVIPDSVTSIGRFAFYNCRSLKSIVIPNSVTSIGRFALSECSSLESIVIPDSVTIIDDRTFKGCRNLESIIIPNSVTHIGQFAFSECSGLESIVIPDSVTSIGVDAFSECSSLNSIVIPDSITIIDDRAFEGCWDLESITIPDSVTSIGTGAFYQCRSLKSIQYKGFKFENLNNINNILIKNGELLIKYNNGENFIIVDKDNRAIEIKDENLGELYNNILKVTNITDENSYSQLYEKLAIVYKKGFRKPSQALMKISVDNLEKLKAKFYYKLLINTDISNNIQSSLLELVYSMGAFEGDTSTESRKQFILSLLVNPPTIISKENFNKIEELEPELVKKAYLYNEKKGYVLGQLSKQEKYKLVEILKTKTNLMINNSELHQMFDGMDLDNGFDDEFYTFFKNNYKEILKDDDYRSALAPIQRNFEKYCNKLGINVENITIKAIAELRSNDPYADVKPGCYNLAREAKSVEGGIGVSEDAYKWYQDEAYPKMIKRERSSIPNIKVSLENGCTGEFLRLDDINNLLAGEKTNCCQVYKSLGSTSMKHACFSDHGRIFLIRNSEGEILGQSWVWFNNNTLCFDNFEASIIYKKSVDPAAPLKKSFEKYKDSVRKIYKLAANKVMKETNEKIENLKKHNPNHDYETSKIKAVTLGVHHDDSGFTGDFKKINQSNIVLPPSDLGFTPYTDAESQVLIAGSEIKEKRGLPKEPIFRDKRKIKEYMGDAIDEDVIYQIKQIEKEGHREEMRVLQPIATLKELARVNDCKEEQINIIIGEDFYYMYIDREQEIEIVDLVRGVPRFKDEKFTGSIEMYNIFNKILSKSNGKTIKASLRQDTSNILVLKMLQQGKIELEGPVYVRDFDSDAPTTTLSPADYMALLKKADELIKSKEDSKMYDVSFKTK